MFLCSEARRQAVSSEVMSRSSCQPEVLAANVALHLKMKDALE